MVYKSSESSGFSFAFHELEHISNSNGAFNVSDQVSLISFLTGDEDDLDLGDTSSGSGSSKQLCDSGFDWFWVHWLFIFINI